jgi:mercuric ion binding protein
MKSNSFILLVLSLLFFSCQKGVPTKTETFKVWGNCEKCKTTIETSCTVDGVKEKNWNVDSKLMTVTFDTTVITLNAIQELIAKSGYDNEAFYANDYAYNKLESCCQYERKPVDLP